MLAILEHLLILGLELHVKKELRNIEITVVNPDSGETCTQQLPMDDHLQKVPDCIKYCINKVC